MTTSINNSEIAKFKTILETYNGVFFKTLKTYGSGLLEEIQTDKIDEVFSISNIDPTSATHNTSDLSKFIRKIINFDINDTIPEGSTPNNLRFIKKTTTGGSITYDFDHYNKINIIETLKVINVFVDILEAYKYCIDTNDGIPNSGASLIKSGFDNNINIDRIELVSNATRFYSNSTMYPEEQFKNIGYIRKIKESSVGDDIRVLYLSIESFYTELYNINYDNMFTKTSVNPSATPADKITTNILDSNSLANVNTAYELQDKNYSRQIFRDKNEIISYSNLTLVDRNKNLIKSLLKILLNIDSYQKQTVYALYYYYKFVKLYSVFVINLSNVMYSNQSTNDNVKRIETVNMAVPNMYFDMPNSEAYLTARGISGVQIVSEGKGYISNSPYTNYIGFTATNVDGITVDNTVDGSATVTSTSKGIITSGTVAVITNRGDKYILNPTAKFVTLSGGSVDYTLVDAVDIAASGQTPAVMTGKQPATLKTTIVPIAVYNDNIGQDANINYLRKTVNNIYDSISVSTFEIIKSFDERPDINNIKLFATGNTATFPKVTLLPNKKVALKITYAKHITDINYADTYNNIKNDYFIFDNRNKYSYNIESIRRVSTTELYINIDAVINTRDIREDPLFKNTVLFVNEKNLLIQEGASLTTELVIFDITVTDVSRIDNFLQLRKKDLSIYKEEYTKEKKAIQLLDIQINKNSIDIEHQKNLYDTEYNKNLFLNRQIISYNTIIAFIILVLVVINIIYVDKLFVKVVSLVCLAVVLLLFVIYFISNITYIESFTSLANLVTADPTYGDLLVATKSNAASSTVYISEIKIPCLQRLIKNMNFKFISYFEKIIITIPSTDSITFYKDIKMYVGKDIEIKNYSHKISEFNKNDTVNNIDLLKYENENNKLYLMSLLIATIIFLSIYNMYLNYVSNDKFLSLTVFICVIILFIIGSYYIIRSNRRVRSFHKNIYWGPETSYRF